MAGLKVCVSSRSGASLVESARASYRDLERRRSQGRFPNQNLSCVSLGAASGPSGVGCLEPVPALLSGFLSSFSPGLSHPVSTGPAPEPSEQEAKEELRVMVGLHLGNPPDQPNQKGLMKKLRVPGGHCSHFNLCLWLFCKNNGNSGWSFLLQLLCTPEGGRLWRKGWAGLVLAGGACSGWAGWVPGSSSYCGLLTHGLAVQLAQRLECGIQRVEVTVPCGPGP